MRKLGIYGIASGFSAAIFAVLLLSWMHSRNVYNLSRFGAEIFKFELLESQMKDLWFELSYLSFFMVGNIFLGVGLIRETTHAVKGWLYFYSSLLLFGILFTIYAGAALDLLLFDIYLMIILLLSLKWSRNHSKTKDG